MELEWRRVDPDELDPEQESLIDAMLEYMATLDRINDQYWATWW